MLNLIVAHAGEAKPLIRHFRLRRRDDVSALAIYAGDDLQLVQSGPGKIAAAMATGFAAGCDRTGPAAWLNVGIAGHRERDIGDAVVAHRVRDRETGQTWYPQILWDAPCATDAVITCGRPETDYPEAGVFDMEASGFIEAAARTAPLEIVHCLKVISDNARRPAGRAGREQGPDLIAAQLATIETVIAHLQALSTALNERRADPPGYAALTARFRFSATERRQLKRLLTRLAALRPDAAPADLDLPRCRSGRDALVRLAGMLDERAGRALP